MQFIGRSVKCRAADNSHVEQQITSQFGVYFSFKTARLCPVVYRKTGRINKKSYKRNRQWIPIAGAFTAPGILLNMVI